jgi:hypothetical protein
MKEIRTLTLLLSKPKKVIPTIPQTEPTEEINFANEDHERLSDRQETQDRCVLANIANGTPIEPLLGIPQAEQSKYKNADGDNPYI